MSKSLKLCLVSSRGGHLYQLVQLKRWWRKYQRCWITGRGSDTEYLLKNEKLYYGFFPESRNAVNAIRNFFFGFWVIVRENPDLIVSTGAGIAPPVFMAAKILGKKLVFVDSVSFVLYPSLSAKIVSFFADKTIVQHKRILTKLRGAEYWGGII